MGDLSDGESGFAPSGTPGRSRNMEALLRATRRLLTHDLHPPALQSASQKVGTVDKKMRIAKRLRPSPRRTGAPTPATARKRKRRKVAAAPRDAASPPATSQSRPQGPCGRQKEPAYKYALQSPPLIRFHEPFREPLPPPRHRPRALRAARTPPLQLAPDPLPCRIREASELSEGEEPVQQVHPPVGDVAPEVAEVEEPAAQPPAHHEVPKFPEGDEPVESQQLSEHVDPKLRAREKSPQRHHPTADQVDTALPERGKPIGQLPSPAGTARPSCVLVTRAPLVEDAFAPLPPPGKPPLPHPGTKASLPQARRERDNQLKESAVAPRKQPSDRAGTRALNGARHPPAMRNHKRRRRGGRRQRPRGAPALLPLREPCDTVFGEATFVRRDGVATVIDLALVSERCSYSWQRAPDTAGSDHYPITLRPTKPSRGATRVYAVVRWPLFREMCARPSHCSDYFAHIAECAGRATTRVIVPAGTPCPDIKLLNVRAARRRAQRRAVGSGAAADWTTYNRLDAMCRRHARQLRRRSWAGLCSSLARPRNQHRGWRVLNALLNPRTPRFPVLAIAVAQGISELALAEQLPPLLPSLSTHAQAITSLCEEDFTFHELQRVLCRGRRRSAPGQDGVTHQMLRNLDEDQRHFLLDAFNGVLRSGCLPGLQAAADAVGDFLRAIGLRLSAAKSEAIMVYPRAAARRHTGCVVVDGVPLPWRLTVRYLGRTIDHRLTWLPAVKWLRAAMRQVEGAVRALLARGDGCPPPPPLFAVGMYGAVALSRVLYALPLCNLRPHLWRRIDGDHRRVLRMCHGLPSASRVAETLAETGAWPVSLTADLRALGHLERLSHAPGAGPMLSYLRELPKSLPAEAEIRELDHELSGEQHVLAFQVPVCNVVTVKIGNGGCKLNKYVMGGSFMKTSCILRQKKAALTSRQPAAYKHYFVFLKASPAKPP
ncbi:hypothetical protein HPB49_007411 [Dermacentor silvarum]|uniref:Uncharacterized protein n=1 Tax=Dermacentor silvarum TaxID=543639 RepID=A0ACB8D3S7_DERSI|nr:hypothetical protein HPB49_007411 [Dermacentor silvarum]